jgi:hypothetical protein
MFCFPHWQVSVYPKEEVPENENSRRVRKRNFFRLFHEQARARKGEDEHTHIPSLVLASAEGVQESEDKAVC